MNSFSYTVLLASGSVSGGSGRQTACGACVAEGRVSQSQSIIDMLRGFGSDADRCYGGHPSYLRVQKWYPTWDEVDAKTWRKSSRS